MVTINYLDKLHLAISEHGVCPKRLQSNETIGVGSGGMGTILTSNFVGGE
jgi:hypothetical protein